MDRSGTWWQRRLAIEPYGAHANADLNWYVHDGPAGPDGLLAWKPKPGVTLNGPQATVNVIGPIAASDAAYRDLYAYLLGIDFVDHLELVLRPVDEPLRWIIDDGRALHLTDLVDGLWVRLLDVSAALAARAYAVTGRLVLEVVDTSMGGPAAGRYELVSDEGRSTCVRTEAPPDLTIDQRTLASIYLGGHRLHQFATADHLREHSPGALDLTDLWFSTPIPPWNQTMF